MVNKIPIHLSTGPQQQEGQVHGLGRWMHDWRPVLVCCKRTQQHQKATPGRRLHDGLPTLAWHEGTTIAAKVAPRRRLRDEETGSAGVSSAYEHNILSQLFPSFTWAHSSWYVLSFCSYRPRPVPPISYLLIILLCNPSILLILPLLFFQQLPIPSLPSPLLWHLYLLSLVFLSPFSLRQPYIKSLPFQVFFYAVYL